jgi:hypothetical protein
MHNMTVHVGLRISNVKHSVAGTLSSVLAQFALSPNRCCKGTQKLDK